MKNYSFVVLFLFSLISLHLSATGLQPIETDEWVRVQKIDFDITMQGTYVSGMMEVQFVADKGTNSAANLRFPLPRDAVLHKAEIFLPAQEKWMQAETLGRQEGENIYQTIVQQKYDPLLIQRIGTDFYRARVYPINQDAQLRIKIYYAHLLERTEQGYRLRVPFANKDSSATTPTDGVSIALHAPPNEWTANAWKVEDELGSPGTSSVDLSDGTASLSVEDFKMEKDITLDLFPKEPPLEATALYYRPESPSLTGHFHVQWQPNLAAYSSPIPRNVVFVIDVSGSMTGAKIAQTRKAVISCLGALNPEDYFGLVAFDSKVYSFQETMNLGNNTQEAIRWVAGLEPGTNTAMSAGLTKGTHIGVTSPLQGSPIDLLLVTDGLPNVGSSTVNDILADIGSAAEQLGNRIRIFALGIGADLDQKLLNGLAQQTGGESTFALKDNEITGQILDLFSRVRSGGLSQIQVTLVAPTLQEQNEVFTWSRLFSETPLQLSAKGNFSEVMELKLNASHDKTPVALTTSLKVLTNTEISPIAAPLAAKSWADQLERQIDQEGETSELIKQAVHLAKTYGIVTRYSSLLALENEEMYIQQGVKRIERDSAGIALQDVEDSVTGENQVGGEGTTETPSSPPMFPPFPIPIDDKVYVSENAVLPGASTTTTGNSVLDDANVDREEKIDEQVETSCEPLVLDDNLHLHISQLVYEGQYYWADLQLDDTLMLEVTNYGEMKPPAQTCNGVFLSSTMRLYLPHVIYQGKVSFYNVILKPVPSSNGRLKFKIFDLKEGLANK